MPSYQYIDRLMQAQLLQAAEQEVITLILGARQVGKTTLIKFVKDKLNEGNKKSDAQDLTNLNTLSLTSDQCVFDYNLDDINLRASLKKDSMHIQKDIQLSLGMPLTQLDRRIYIFIDEIQKLPILLDWVKQVFDEHSDQVKFFLTGSSSMHIRQASAETLAGRIEYINVFPLSFCEIAHAETGNSYRLMAFLLKQIQDIASKQQDAKGVVKAVTDTVTQTLQSVTADINRRKADLEHLFQSHLLYGGLPRVNNADGTQKQKMVANYIQVYLEKEIAALSKNIDLELFGLSLKAFAAHNGRKLNLVKVSKQIGISRPSLYNYLDLLESTFLGKKIYPLKADKGSMSSLNLYILDTGILNNLNFISSLAELQLRDVYDKTIASWILSNILAQFSLLDNPPQVTFWQDYFKHKIDFVISTSFIDLMWIVRSDLSETRLEGILSALYKTHKKDAIVFVPNLHWQDPVELQQQVLTFGEYSVTVFKVPLYVLG